VEKNLGKFEGAFPFEKKKKKPPKNNKRITEYIECERCGGQATSTHEIWFGNPDRQTSINNNWQEKLCLKCHELMHNDEVFRKLAQSEWQERIMHERGWTIQDWRDNTGIKNYL